MSFQEGDNSKHLKRIQMLESELNAIRIQKQEIEQQLERTSMRRRELEKLLSLHEKTGLPTHFSLRTELQEMLEQRSRESDQSHLSVMILHLDSTVDMLEKTTKASISEWVLYQLGNRFLESLAPREKVFHTRDNEFVFLLFDPQKDELYAKVKSIFCALRKPFVFANLKVTLDGKAGIAFFPEHGISRSLLMRHADIALDAAVEQDRCMLVFHEELMKQVVEKVDLQNSIIRAIEAPAMENLNKEFSLNYQPKIFLSGDPDHPTVEGMEAEVLIRWNHPEKGNIPPDKFIGLAEETGLIMPIGKWVLYTALVQQKRWKDENGIDLPLAVNLSARQMRNDDVLDIMRGMVDRGTLDPEKLIIEITETSIFEDPQQARHFMDALKELGVRISIDDFGTGYSSFSYLSRFPLNEIKIDRSFVSRVLTSQADEAIVCSIAHLAEQMNWNVVAEGVEHPEEIQRLRTMGIPCYQGYVLCRPQPAETLLDYWKKYAPGTVLELGKLTV